MNDLLSSVKKDIGHLKCPTCGNTPSVSISGDNLTTKGCECQDFKTLFQKELKKSYEKHIKKQMDNMFKNLGKR